MNIKVLVDKTMKEGYSEANAEAKIYQDELTKGSHNGKKFEYNTNTKQK